MNSPTSLSLISPLNDDDNNDHYDDDDENDYDDGSFDEEGAQGGKGAKLVVHLSVIPPSDVPVRATVDARRPLGLSLSPENWVMGVAEGGQVAGKEAGGSSGGGLGKGVRVAWVEIPGQRTTVAVPDRRALQAVLRRCREGHDDGHEVTLVATGGLAGQWKWCGGAVSANGRYVYGFPSSASNVLEIDTAAGTATTFGNCRGLCRRRTRSCCRGLFQSAWLLLLSSSLLLARITTTWRAWFFPLRALPL